MSTPDRPSPMSDAFRFFAPEIQQDPYSLYARARAEEPVFFSRELDMWVVTRHADVCAVLRDPARFSSRLTTEAVRAPPPEVLQALRKGFPRRAALINADPPEHTRVRRLSTPAFSAARVAAMEGTVREIANALVDAFYGEGEADLVARFTGPLPRRVIADIVGVPRADTDLFAQWADEAAVLLFTAGLETARWVQAAEGYAALQRYVAAMIEDRRRAPRDDLISTLVTAKLEDGARLDDLEIVANIVGFLIAGHKTTTDMIGNALVLLLRNPDQLAALVRDPTLAPAAVEEVLRRDTSVPGMHRVTTEDVEVGGVAIPRGARVLALFGSANHDEAVFVDPLRFDIRRADVSEHLAFGRGVHFCIGAPLARLEGAVALEVISSRLRGLRFAITEGEPVRFAQVTAFRGPVALRLAWDVDRIGGSATPSARAGA